LFESFGANECTGGIAGVFVDAARDFALGRLAISTRRSTKRRRKAGPLSTWRTDWKTIFPFGNKW